MGELCAVTGASGFTGSYLARRLLADGNQVRVMVRKPEDAERFSAEGMEVVEGDIRDVDAHQELVEGADVVYHIAAMFREAKFPESEYLAVNRDATLQLAQAAQNAGVRRFVHCSTIGVHGDIEQPPGDEDSPFRPGDPYQRTKLAGEEAVREFGRSNPLEVVVVRPASIYGPGDLRLLKLFKMIHKGRWFVLGSGDALFHLVYVEDLVDGFIRAAHTEGVDGEVFIVAGGEAVSQNELAARIARIMGVRDRFPHFPAWPFQILGSVVETICVPLRIDPPIYRRRVDFFTKSRSFKIDKAERMLVYQPKVSVDEGLSRTFEWYRDEGLL
jgi:nucleoside-diphosphate-sugar epimerase